MLLLAKYGEAHTFTGLKLRDAADTNRFKANPTLAAGDVKISKDGGALTNLATLPDAFPASSTEIRVQLSAAELQCKIATVNFIDQTASEEWLDESFLIFTYGNPSAHFPFDFSSATISIPQAQLDQITDKVWDEQLSDHQVLGSFGLGLRLSATERNTLTDTILDKANTIETGVALRGAIRLMLAALAGVSSGAGTNTIVYNNAVANTKARLTATVSDQENRLAVVTDQT